MREIKRAVVPGKAIAEARDPYSAAELRDCGVWVPAFAGDDSQEG
jgi:hypothetical protein